MIKSWNLLVSIASLTLCFTAKAQLALPDTTGLSLARKLNNIHIAFNKLSDPIAKENIIRDLPELVLSQDPSVATQQEILVAYLAMDFASKGDKINFQRLFDKLKVEARRRTVTVEVVKSSVTGGHLDFAYNLTKDSLDQIANPERLADVELRSYMTNLLKVYLKLESNKSNVIHYLHQLYNASGGYFDRDIAARSNAPDLAPSEQFFWHYAAILYQNREIDQAVNVLERAVRNGSLPNSMLMEVCHDFDPSDRLYKKVTAQQKKNDALFVKNLKQLYKKRDPQGNMLNAKRLEGKYVLLDFWGSWCLACRYTHPDLIVLYDKYKEKGFEIVGVAYEHAKDSAKAQQLWIEAIEKDNIPWLNVLNNEQVEKFDALKAFQIGIFPTKILIDPSGKEIGRFYGGSKDELADKMKNIFGF